MVLKRIAGESWAEQVAFAVILLVGIGLRWHLAAAQPSPMLWYDTGNYVTGSLPGAAPFFDRPLGYSWFLRALRLHSLDLRLIQQVQLVMGVMSALTFHAIARRLMPSPPAVALGVLALTIVWPLNVMLETYVLAETPFLLLTALTILVALSGIQRRSVALTALAGALLGVATLFRITGLIVCVSLPPTLFVLARWPEKESEPRTAAFAWLAPLAMVVPALTILLAYAGNYHAYHGVWALESWSGINRYAMLAPLIDPADAEPDAGAAAILRAHQDDRTRGPSHVMWSPESALGVLRRERAMTTPELDRWAGHTATRAILRHPRAAAQLLAHNAYEELTTIDSFRQQVPVDSTLAAQRAVLAVYGLDATGWESTHRFRLPRLLDLYALKPLLGLALLLSLGLAFVRQFRQPYQLLISANAAWLLLASSLSVAAEQRHVQLAENLEIVSFALLLGQLWTAVAPHFPSAGRNR